MKTIIAIWGISMAIIAIDFMVGVMRANRLVYRIYSGALFDTFFHCVPVAPFIAFVILVSRIVEIILHIIKDSNEYPSMPDEQ